MKKSIRITAAVLILAVLAPVTLSAQDGGIAQWIRRSGAHKVGGYVTMGLAVTAAGLGMLESQGVLGTNMHPYFGYATAAFAAGASIAGTIAYSDRLDVIWPHAALNGLAVVGFGLNAFVFEGGSPAHVATAASSLALLGASYVAIRLITR